VDEDEVDNGVRDKDVDGGAGEDDNDDVGNGVRVMKMLTKSLMEK